MRLAADSIEPYKTPQGDGNTIACLFMIETLIENYKTPQGDGNYFARFPPSLITLLNLIKPRKGTETEDKPLLR